MSQHDLNRAYKFLQHIAHRLKSGAKVNELEPAVDQLISSIELVAGNSQNCSQEQPVGVSNVSAVLIDDDDFVAKDWNSDGTYLNNHVDYYRRPIDFLNVQHTYPKDTPIFVDWFLEPGVPSLEFTTMLHSLGFSRIIVTSNMKDLNLKAYPWIKQVIDKSNPWIQI